MTSLPVNGLLNCSVNLEIAAKNPTVRKRVKGRSPKQDGAAENQNPGMVPQIAVVPHDIEDLDDEGNEGKRLSKRWTEDEDSSDSMHLNQSKYNLYSEDTRTVDGTSHTSLPVLNGDVPYDRSDQFLPLLEEQRDDEFETQIAGKGDSSSEEGSFTIGLQVFFPFLIAGFGTVSAGILLDIVQVNV